MNVLVVDTSSWISYFKGAECEDLDCALKEGRVFLSPVVAAELLSAQLKPPEREQLIDFLSALPLCDVTFEHWLRVGDLRAQLSRSGLNISTPDAHVAQCALDIKGYLLSEDGIFKKIARHRPLRFLV